MARLFLIRHGKPEAAWGGDQVDPGLSERGRAQAARAAEALAGALSHPTSDTRGLVAGVFRLAQSIACYRLDYRDATAAADALAQLRSCAFEPEVYCRKTTGRLP